MNPEPDERTFVGGLVDAVPAWALGAIGTLLTFALVLKIIGIDFAGPINGISAAYTEAIQAQTAGLLTFAEATASMEEQLNAQRRSFNELNAGIAQRFAEQDAKIGRTATLLDQVQSRMAQNTARIELLEQQSHPGGH